ncbi:phosphate transporter PHO1 [Malania oleifera]|uniref:phosphate transporter PHO1 n=1 Tax=Malania oleifera TaxID=397392 RepID=UPI0025AEA90C|nr:phosphate transporter PHO1 [Malania oleifera]
MVKFSKELEAQLIPEWKEAFVNYWQLKKYIKKIKLSTSKPPHPIKPSFNFPSSFLLHPFRSLHTHISEKSQHKSSDHIIQQVKSKSTTDAADEEREPKDEQEEEHLHETELRQFFSKEDEVGYFFENLDVEVDKVNKFYRSKESEFLERAEILNKQLQTLQDLKQILSDRRRKSTAGIFPNHSYSSSTRSFGYTSESPGEPNGTPGNIAPAEDGTAAADERNCVNLAASAARAKTRSGHNMGRIGMTRIEIPATTPARTITAVTSMLWEELIVNNNNNNKNSPKKDNQGGSADFINRKKIQCAEKMIRGAFVELYKGLALLKTYSSLNMVAFVKILKKFDKVSNQQASANYLKAVKRSHFISSDKVVRLMDEVESIFTKHFANSDRKKAMKFLRPQQQKDSHMVTFLVGLFTGCFVTLFCVYAILAHLTGLFSIRTNQPAYMEVVYPVFSMFALLSLHIFMYGCNVLMWKTTRINYNFIFEFSPTTALKYRDAFLICTSFMTMVIGAMVAHLILRDAGFSPQQVDVIPGLLLLLFIALLICPFNIFYRPTRYCFIRTLRNIACSPFYKVLMVDFFMADQLTSQIPLLRHIESTACYFVAGSFKTHQFETCKSGKPYRELAYVISFLPYYWRAMQCARRWFDECDTNHLANLGKYVSAMVAAGARLTYARQPTQLWMIIVLVTSVVATLYQLYWDFVKDWGLLHPNSRNPWLRDDLILKKKGIYYISIVLNLVLRVAWVETVTRFNIGMFESRSLDFLVASLEVIRRGHWNFYRLENEHLNNVGKFRAVKTVPLPFRETDSDG